MATSLTTSPDSESLRICVKNKSIQKLKYLSVFVIITAQNIVHDPHTPPHNVVVLVLQLLTWLDFHIFYISNLACDFYILCQVHNLIYCPYLVHHITCLIVDIGCESLHIPCVFLLVSHLRLCCQVVAIIVESPKRFYQLHGLIHVLIRIIRHLVLRL